MFGGRVRSFSAIGLKSHSSIELGSRRALNALEIDEERLSKCAKSKTIKRNAHEHLSVAVFREIICGTDWKEKTVKYCNKCPLPPAKRRPEQSWLPSYSHTTRTPITPLSHGG